MCYIGWRRKLIWDVLFRNTYIYNYLTILVVSWWGTGSYFDDKQIQIIDVELINAAHGSSG